MAGTFAKRIWQPCICQPNELKREIKKKTGGPNGGPSKNLGGVMAHPGPPLESPLGGTVTSGHVNGLKKCHLDKPGETFPLHKKTQRKGINKHTRKLSRNRLLTRLVSVQECSTLASTIAAECSYALVTKLAAKIVFAVYVFTLLYYKFDSTTNAYERANEIWKDGQSHHFFQQRKEL